MFKNIYYPPVAEVLLGFKNDRIQRNLDGFGYLIPAKEKREILGTIWSSVIFPNRAPEGYSLFTTFAGGSRNPELYSNGDDKIIEIVNSGIKSIIGISGGYDFSKIIRWEKAIPQYTLGYYQTLNAIDRFEKNFPGAIVCSNYKGGISVGDCVMNADKTSNKIILCMEKM